MAIFKRGIKNLVERVIFLIIRENIIPIGDHEEEFFLTQDNIEFKEEELIFFDLEHYVYKKPKCVGVFGACIYNKRDKKLYVTQYMIENKGEVVDILILAKKYFIKMKNSGKKVIVTFSGNNDFTVINYLFAKYNINYDFSKEFSFLDIQKAYEKEKGTSIGLKNLEKRFNIFREGEVISGSNLAKTFHKVLKDKEYIERMPREKIETILVYNEQDVVSLYQIFATWDKYINDELPLKEEQVEEIEEFDQTEESEDEVDISIDSEEVV